MHPNLQSESQARFAAMQSVAGTTFLAALLCTLASHYFFVPARVFAVGSLLTGLLLFVAWLLSVRGKTSRAGIFVALALVALLGSLATEPGSSLAAIMATGLSHIAVTLFDLISLAKWRQT
jgi:hypothetical protein